MYLFETIRCENRTLQNLEYHNKRFNSSRHEVYENSQILDLEEGITIPDWVGEGIYRCRVSYDEKIQKIEFFEYQYKHPKRIKLIEDASIDYHLKYENRLIFNAYLADNKDFDDILFLQNGFLTDTTYTNLVLFDGKHWITPKTYLLNGTKRQYLLDNQFIKEQSVSVNDLSKFSKIGFINAMRGIELEYNFITKSDTILLEI